MSGPRPGGREPSDGGVPVEAVRSATEDDGPRLVELAGELVSGIASQRGGSLLVDPTLADAGDVAGAARIHRLLVDGGTRVVVGTLDGAVVGFAVCHLADLGGHGRHGVLDACYVEPEARGVGIGRLLLDAALSWLDQHGCRGVDGVALPGDRGAKNFYESAGFKARLITMHRQTG